MKKQNIFLQILIVILSLFFCALACVTTIAGLSLASAKQIVTQDFWSTLLVDQDAPVGSVMNLLEGEGTYDDNATMADITFMKLDEETKKEYNLTQENLNELYQTEAMSQFMSQKMESAMTAAVNGEEFSFKAEELVDVMRETKDEYCKITGKEMSDEQFNELQAALENAGIAEIEYDFSEGGTSNGISFVKDLIDLPIHWAMYGITLLLFLIILLLNRRYMHRTLLYAGTVLGACGFLFMNIMTLFGLLTGMFGELPETVNGLMTIVGRAAYSSGRIFFIIGIVMLVAFVVFFVLGIVRFFISKKRKKEAAKAANNAA